MQKTTLVLAILFLGVPGGEALAQGSGSSRAGQSGSSRAVQPSSVQPSSVQPSSAQPSSSPSSRGNSAAQATRQPPTPDQYAATFWAFLNSAKSPYRSWGNAGKTQLPASPGGGAVHGAPYHMASGKTYVNGIAGRDLKKAPLNSVFVREEYAADGQTLQQVTVMYRSKGVDPANGDWYWMMFHRDGKLAKLETQQGDRPIMGRVQQCIDCHRKAGGNDFVFMNERPAAGTAPAKPAGSGSSR